MKARLKQQDGVIALEASISLSLFMFLVLLMYSFFLVFEAQYTVEHALLESSKSMAMETYVTEKVVKGSDTSTGQILTKQGSILSILQALGLEHSVKHPDFASYAKWYNNEGKTQAVATQRVYAYLAGDKDEANALLKKLRVKDGADGLDFSDTKVEGDDLYIRVRFTCKTIFDFPAFKLGEVPLSLTARAALWKSSS